MNLEELYGLEKLERTYLAEGQDEGTDLIFDKNEFLLLEALFGGVQPVAVEVNSISFSASDTSALKDFFAPLDFESDIDFESLDIPASLSEEQASFVEGILSKLDEVEEVWEFEDDTRWEFDPAIKSVGVLFMMNEIDRDFGDEDNSSSKLTEAEFDFLSVIYGDNLEESAGIFNGVTFTEEELDYIRMVFSETELVYEVELNTSQEDFIKGILEKSQKVAQDDESEDIPLTPALSIEELLEMDLEDRKTNKEGLYRFTDEQVSFLQAIFQKQQPKLFKTSSGEFSAEQLQYLKEVFREEKDLFLDNDVDFSPKQEVFIDEILQTKENHEHDDAWDDEMSVDIEVLFMMDELEREEMKAIGEKDGDLLFDDEQYRLLQGTFAVIPPEEGIEIGLNKVFFSKEQLVYLNAVFKFEEERQENYTGEPLSTEQTKYVMGILEKVKGLGEEM